MSIVTIILSWAAISIFTLWLDIHETRKREDIDLDTLLFLIIAAIVFPLGLFAAIFIHFNWKMSSVLIPKR